MAALTASFARLSVCAPKGKAAAPARLAARSSTAFAAGAVALKAQPVVKAVRMAVQPVEARHMPGKNGLKTRKAAAKRYKVTAGGKARLEIAEKCSVCSLAEGRAAAGLAEPHAGSEAFARSRQSDCYSASERRTCCEHCSLPAAAIRLPVCRSDVNPLRTPFRRLCAATRTRGTCSRTRAARESGSSLGRCVEYTSDIFRAVSPRLVSVHVNCQSTSIGAVLGGG